MTLDEIDERYHDAALDEDGDGWPEDPGRRDAVVGGPDNSDDDRPLSTGSGDAS